MRSSAVYAVPGPGYGLTVKPHPNELRTREDPDNPGDGWDWWVR
jgi:hypothetical protein